MEDSENAIKFCRLLCCMKTNYQLSHIVRVPFYNDWIKMVMEFTRHSFSAQHEVRDGAMYMSDTIRYDSIRRYTIGQKWPNRVFAGSALQKLFLFFLVAPSFNNGLLSFLTER